MSPIISVSAFEGDMRSTINRWKFRKHIALTGVLSTLIVERLSRVELVEAIDVVTWAPTSNRRRRHRGYDQAELLARAVARNIRRPCRRLLIRTTSTSQTGRSRWERMVDAPEFEARPMRRPLRVLVIDDVVTTGSTLRSAEAALRRAGSRSVVLVALSLTPSGGSSSRALVGRSSGSGAPR